MKVTREKFDESLARYAREYIVPRARKKTTLFLLGAAAGLGRLRLTDAQFQSLCDAGVSCADGTVDTDLLRKAVDGGLDLAGELYIAQLGLTLYRADLAAFFTLLETGSLPVQDARG